MAPELIEVMAEESFAVRITGRAELKRAGHATCGIVMVLARFDPRNHWKWDDFCELAHSEPATIASRLLAALGKLEDDATIIVAKRH